MAKRIKTSKKVIERHDDYTVTKYRVLNAGNTREERVEFWASTREQREKNGNLNGCGFVEFNAETGEVRDYSFKSEEAVKEYLAKRTISEYIADAAANAGVEYNEAEPLFAFPELGIGTFSLLHPNADKFLKAISELMFDARYGELPWAIASILAKALYRELGMDEMPDAA